MTVTIHAYDAMDGRERDIRTLVFVRESAWVHAEFDYYPFYERHGYMLSDDVYDNGRHGWLSKPLDLPGGKDS